MQAHVDNARIVAEWLDADPRIEFVNWAGLRVAPAPRAREEVPAEGPGLGVLLRRQGRPGSRRSASASSRASTCASHLANIGDAKTLVIHPASTTHAQLSEQQLVDAGVLPGLVRISVGIEDPEDIIYDLDQALTAATEGRMSGHGTATRPMPRTDLETVHLSNGLTLRHPVELAAREAAASRSAPGSGRARRSACRSCATAKSVAIVGASPNPARSSYFVATYLQQSSDYELYFVNPNADRDPRRRRSTAAWRRPAGGARHRRRVPQGSDIPSVIDDVVAIGAKTIWVQLGIWNQDAAIYGESKGLTVVMDRCIKVEHARFHGGLHLLGFDTGQISAQEARPLDG